MWILAWNMEGNKDLNMNEEGDFERSLTRIFTIAGMSLCYAKG